MRNVFVRLGAALFVLGIASGQAAAQQPPQARRPPPEVGVGVTRFFPIYADSSTDSLDEGSADLRVTLPFTPRFAFEGIGTIGQRGNEYWSRTEGLYLMQIRQRLRRTGSSPFQPFITYGAAGYYAHVAQRDVTIPQRGGGSYIIPADSYNEVDEPFAIAVGAGFQQRLAGYAAVRAEAQLLTFLYLPLGYRFSTSVSIPLGRYSTN
jgi:hypothetical protein